MTVVITDPDPAFLSLPSEIHSHIASYLTLEQLIPFLSLHPVLLSLTQSHLSPLPQLIRNILSRGSPYPPILAKLPSLLLFLPDDGGALFIDILVQARPRWILERLELGRWKESTWKEAFERRFLPSWKRYKGEDDTWRAVFLRLLGRLEHRNLGCTHEESWTRFVTLHRNGSASLNRIYSRQFDPYQIYDELKHQNNFSSEPTTVRVVVHLQDVRIIVLGVLYRYPSFSVNWNAHDLLHPPLLKEWVEQVKRIEAGQKGAKGVRDSDEKGNQRARAATFSHPTASVSASHPSRSASPVIAESPHVSRETPVSPSVTALYPTLPPTTRRSTFSSFFPTSTKSKRSSQLSAPTIPLESPSMAQGSMGRLGSILTLTRSRDSDDGSKKKWGRRRSSGSGSEKSGRGPVIPASALFADHEMGNSLSNNTISDIADGGGKSIPAAALFTDYASTSTPGPSILNRSVPVQIESSAEIDRQPIEQVVISDPIQSFETKPIDVKRPQLPYPPMRRPQPAASYRLYPNYTPPLSSSLPTDTSHGVSQSTSNLYDRRQDYDVTEDDYAGYSWSNRLAEDGEEGEDEGDERWRRGERMVEWDKEDGVRKRWVGPIIVIAQLHPSYHPHAQPPGVDPTLPTEGPNPDLGPRGMYVSLGFEDLEAIMGWVELKGGGAYVADPRRGGMGFD